MSPVVITHLAESAPPAWQPRTNMLSALQLKVPPNMLSALQTQKQKNLQFSNSRWFLPFHTCPPPKNTQTSECLAAGEHGALSCLGAL